MYVCVARSSHLVKKGAYLVVLSKGDSLLFEGCLELQVLAGLLHVHGYTVTPSHPPLPLFSTTHSSRLPITAIDPHSVRSRRLKPTVQRLCKPVVKFVASGFNLERASSVIVCDGLDLDDIRWLNSLRGVAIACVCVVWNLDSPLVSGLQTIPRCGLPKAPPQTAWPLSGDITRSTFKIIDMNSSTSYLRMPAVHNTMLMDITEYRGAVVLVCGEINTGKSTFCRCVMNSFLNKLEKVGYLECDVGQPQFTVSAVTSLHVLTNPVFGSAYTDPRNPYKAYYYGHLEPAEKPRYYVRLIEQLYSLFMSDIHGNGEVPLVINTCGWTADLGVPLMMDVIRLTSPTHIIRLVPDTPLRVIHPLTDLLPFTPHTLTSTPGILTLPTPVPHSVEEDWYSTNIPGLQAPQMGTADRDGSTVADHVVTTVNNTGTTSHHTGTTSHHTETTIPQPAPEHVEITDDVIYVDSEDSCEPESDVEIIGYQPPPTLHTTTILPTHTSSPSHNEDEEMREEEEVCRGRKRRRLDETSEPVSRSRVRSSRRRGRATEAKIAKERRRKRGLRKISLPGQHMDWISQATNTTASSEHWQEVESCMIGKWTRVLNYQVGVLRAPSGVRKKDSKLMRTLALAAHFSPLISGCSDHTHFLERAPVLQVPWSDLAIHVLHNQVPRSDMMYAMRGNYVALCHVDPSEIVEEELDDGGRVRFLRTHTPIIEFIAMGIFRGASLDKELYYVITPIAMDCCVAMDTVNVMVMGVAEAVIGFSLPETTPTSFQHITIGQFAWKR